MWVNWGRRKGYGNLGTSLYVPSVLYVCPLRAYVPPRCVCSSECMFICVYSSACISLYVYQVYFPSICMSTPCMSSPYVCPQRVYVYVPSASMFPPFLYSFFWLFLHLYIASMYMSLRVYVPPFACPLCVYFPLYVSLLRVYVPSIYIFLCLIVLSCVSRLHVYIPPCVHLPVCMFHPCVIPSMCMYPSCVFPSVCMSPPCVSPSCICPLRVYVPLYDCFWDLNSSNNRLMWQVSRVHRFTPVPMSI